MWKILKLILKPLPQNYYMSKFINLAQAGPLSTVLLDLLGWAEYHGSSFSLYLSIYKNIRI